MWNGRLRVQWPRVDIPALGGAVTVFIRQLSAAELRGDLTMSGLSRAHLGGTASVNDLVAQAVAIMPGIGATVRSVLEGVADVNVMVADPTICADIGSGLDLSGVSATRAP